MSPITKPETVADPFVEEETIVKLERGAILTLRTKESGSVAWSVRWPDQREKDPLLAAGGWRAGSAESMKTAEAIGRAAYAEGPGTRSF